ncbi:MAG TPA: hypothetical protein VNW28_08685 [Chthoniobacterales bacterium]|jgi:hypothetical protein|nr:hypothetical protein [Chthoniobacterales bacterium]
MTIFLTFFARTTISPAMSKLVVALLSVTFFLAGCAEAPQSQSTGTHSSAAAASVAAVRTQPAASKRSVWVEPPTGSHIGGGFARASGNTGSNDEPGLISAINSINQANAHQREQPFVLAAFSQVSGLSQQQVLTLQNQTRLPLGDLLAFNTIARNRQPKVQELAALKASGKSWAALAGANAMNIATVAQTVRTANDLAIRSYLSASENSPGTVQQLQNVGARTQTTGPGGSRPVGP